MMRPYQITTISTDAFGDIDCTIHGPGLGPSGRRYILATRERAQALVEGLNWAYAAGVKEGIEAGRLEARLKRSASGG